MNTDKLSERSKELSVIIGFLLDNKLKHLIALVFSILVSISMYIYDKNNPIYRVESTYEFSNFSNIYETEFLEDSYQSFLQSFKNNLIATFNFQDYQKNNTKDISGCTSINILKNRLNRFTIVIESKKGFEITDNCKQGIVKYVNDIKKINTQSYEEGINNHIRVLEDSIERGDTHIEEILAYTNNLPDDLNPLEYMHQFNLRKQTVPYLELNRLTFNEKIVEFKNIKKGILDEIYLVSEKKLVVKKYNRNVYFVVFVFFGFLSFLLSIILKK